MLAATGLRDGLRATTHWVAAPSWRPGTRRSRSTLEPLLRWMEDTAHHEPALDEIAAEAGMSVRTLNRRLREQTGTSPHACRRAFRGQAAAVQ
ncbi:AraC family transcriptional regulator [Streptomyces sp. NPDC058304]|uniref:AraC family transcriptional regulator n=1 Tax=Streptomyces sp. NPDC058304 TaxID=3346437 RepID=UPI0036E8C6D3